MSRLFRMSWFLLAATVLAGPIFAQTPWYDQLPLDEIEFLGLENVSVNDIEGVISPFRGQPFSNSVYLELQRQLYATDYFEYIEPLPEPMPRGISEEEAASVRLILTVTENPVVESLSFQGNNRIRSSELLDQVLINELDPINRTEIRNDVASIKDFYTSKGYPNAAIRYELLEPNQDGFNGQRLVFVIDEGPQNTIRRIRFSGNGAFSESALKSLLISKEQNLFDSGLYVAANAEQDSTLIEAFYKEQGYIDAQVLEVIPTPIEDQGEEGQLVLELTYVIEEGNQWFFGEINFEGNQLFSSEELVEQIPLVKDQILDVTALQQGLRAVNELYAEEGYLFTNLIPAENRNEDSLTVDYTVSIVESGRYYIENIIIRGNEKTKDHVILRELPFQVGDVFSVSAIRAGFLALYNTQFFANIDIQYPPSATPGLLDIVITVEETRTLDVRFGASSAGSPEFPLGLIFSFGDSNFLGEGLNLNSNVNINGAEQTVSLSYTDRWLNGQRWSGSASLSFNHSQASAPQDILYPVFDGSEANAVPDPYQGIWLFGSDVSDEGDPYDGAKAGDVFPDQSPNASQISTYNLKTDYEYALSQGENTALYNMTYDEWDVSLGLGTGIRFPTLLGELGLGTNLNIGLNVITYDQGAGRPASEVIRSNHNNAQFVNRLGINASLDTRDYRPSPTRGYYLSDNLTLAGGPMGGSRHFIRNDLSLETYFKLFEAKFSDSYSITGVFNLNGYLSVLFPTLFRWEGGDASTYVTEGYQLFSNGQLTGRGWGLQSGGEGLFNASAEFRFSIVPGALWFDTFFEASQFKTDRAELFDGDDWNFTLGFGLRSIIPQLPLRLYLGKRFNLDENGGVQWQAGNVFPNPDRDDAGLDLILVFKPF